jgi:hypothetical protein
MLGIISKFLSFFLSLSKDDNQQESNAAWNQPHTDDKTTSTTQDSSFTLTVILGILLALDIVLFVVRMFWLVNQLRAARHGYEDRIPTDPVCQRLLALQTGLHFEDLYG